MRYEAEHDGHAMIFEGVIEMCEDVREGYAMHMKKTGKEWYCYENRDSNVETARQPYELGVHMVENLWQELQSGKHGTLPNPKCTRRRPVWDEDHGHTLDLARYMAGSGEPCWRNVKRVAGNGPRVVAMFCNLDCPGCEESTAWRGALGVLLADILEDAGYMVDMHVWCMGRSVYPEPKHRQFQTLRIKPPGMPVDVGELMRSLSSWFTSSVVFGSFCCCPTPPRSIGGFDATLRENYKQHMSVDGDYEIVVPFVYNQVDAAKAAVELLEKLVNELE